MKQGFYSILSNDKIAENVYKMKLVGDATSIVNAGEFINIKICPKKKNGGEAEIRTLGAFASLVFKTSSLNHSDTSPYSFFCDLVSISYLALICQVIFLLFLLFRVYKILIKTKSTAKQLLSALTVSGVRE